MASIAARLDHDVIVHQHAIGVGAKAPVEQRPRLLDSDDVSANMASPRPLEREAETKVEPEGRMKLVHARAEAQHGLPAEPRASGRRDAPAVSVTRRFLGLAHRQISNVTLSKSYVEPSGSETAKRIRRSE